MNYELKGIVVNNQAFGDMLLGTHACALMKKKYPNSYIAMVISENTTLTTVERKGFSEIIEILKLQPGIDDVITYGGRCFRTISRGKPFNNRVDFKLHQFEWYSDLGIVKSMQTEFLLNSYIDSFDTETYFSTGNINIIKNSEITTAGELDWVRKIGFFPKKLFNYITDKGYIIKYLGADTRQGTYLDSLKELEKTLLYIGPIGSMSHFAAGLGLSTINVCSVFPAQYDSPEYYHSGFHKSVLTNRKEDYSMITPKYYSNEIQQGWGNPKTVKGFWDYVDSDDYYIIEQDLIKKFEEWSWTQ